MAGLPFSSPDFCSWVMRMLSKPLFPACCGLLAAASLGCARWTHVSDDTTRLPGPRMSPDSVVLEVALVPLPASDNHLQANAWQEVDELHLDQSVQKRLWENGFRFGLVSGQIPEPIRALLPESGESGDPAPQPAALNDSGVTQHRLQRRAGQPGRIVTHARVPAIHVLTVDKGYAGGRTIHDAECVFTVKTFPQGDGRVQVELVPEIHHGQPKTEVVGRNGAWQLRSDRQKEVFEELKMVAMLAPGQSLLLSCSPDNKGLGHHFFGTDKEGVHKLLLVRLAQVQFDDLFAPEKMVAPLSDTQ